MAIDNIIAAGIQPATPIMSPMQTMGGLMQLRGQMADQSLREAQMVEVRQRQQNEKLRGDQLNLELKDANNFAEIQKDPSLMRQFAETGDVSMFHQKGISPAFIEKLAEGRGKRITSIQTETVTGQTIKKNATEQMIAVGDGIMAPMAGGKPVDIATANSRYQGALPRLKELALLRGDDPAKLPGSIASLEQIQGVLSGLNLDAGLYDAGLKRTEETAKRDKEVAQAEIESKKNAGTDAQGLTSKDRFEIDQLKAATDNARAQLPNNQADAAIAQLESKFRETHGGLSAAEVQTGQHQRAMETIARQANMPINAPPATIRSVIEKDKFAQEIRDTIAELKAHPDAIGYKTVVGQKTLQELNPAGVKARAMLAKVTTREYHEVSGAAVTPAEDNRFKPYVPNMMDSADAAITKLEQMEKTLVSENQATREAYPSDKYRPIPKVKGDSQAGASGIPTVSSQAEFDKLPSGAEFMEDGKKYRKP